MVHSVLQVLDQPCKDERENMKTAERHNGSEEGVMKGQNSW